MWLKLFLLTFYLIFLFFVSRILEAASWYQGSEAFLASFVAIDPISLSVKTLKQILDSRGISYFGVVEKQELIDLIESSGKPSSEELIDNSALGKVSPQPTQFTCGSHFYEEVEDTKDSAWLVQVVMDDEDKPLLSNKVWREVTSKVSEFGIRTGQFKCSLDKRLCNRKGWNTPRLILALPRGEKAKEDVVLHDFLLHSSSELVLQWVRTHLASRVKKINSAEELENWMQYSENESSVIKVVFFSILNSSPMFLSSLAIKFNGRVKFAVVDVTKDNHKRTLTSVNIPLYLIQSPEKTFMYGTRKGECFNFKSMEIFLKTFVPEMNDVFLWSLLIVNALASFELFFMYSHIWKHFFLFIICIVKYNCFLFLFWLLILALNQFTFMSVSTNAMLKCLRLISSSYIAAVVRSDYKSFYSYTFLFTTFVMFSSIASFILKKYKWILDDDNNVSSNWWFMSSDGGLIGTYFFRPMATLTRPNASQDIEEGMELLIERLAVPNFWLQPMISPDYINDLPVWKYQGWCEADDAEENKSDTLCSSDEESANITTIKQVVKTIVPNTHTSVDNHYSDDSLPSICSSISSQDKSLNASSQRTEKAPVNSSTPLLSSAAFCSAKVSENKSYVIPDAERAPKGMLEIRECSICLESYKYGEFLCGLPCGHNFHMNCIMMWLTRDNHCCPICRWPSYKPKNQILHAHLQ